MIVLWTKESILKLQEIEEYISHDNLATTQEFVDELISVTEVLKNNPELGRVVPELSINNIRELIHKNYRIVYIIKKKSVEVLTVFEGHRLLKKSEIFNT